MKSQFLALLLATWYLFSYCNIDKSALTPGDSIKEPAIEGYLKLYFAEDEIASTLPWDSIPTIAIDSIVILEKYEKTLSPAKVIDYKQHYSILGGGAIDVTVSGSVSGCENRVYFLQAGSDSLYQVGTFVPGPYHYYFAGSIIPDPSRDYPPIYFLFFDSDNNNSGVITLHFSNGDTTLSYEIDAAEHTVVLDEEVYWFKLDHITSQNIYSDLYLYYIDGLSNHLSSAAPFFVLFPVVTDSSGYQKVYKLINITPGSKALGIYPWNGNLTFPDEFGYAFKIKFPHQFKR